MGNSNTVPTERIRIFDKTGVPLAEFRANVARSWVIGGEGRAQFMYPTRKTDVVNEDVLQFGNWVLIQNSQLPAWVGVIDTPREWSTRNVNVSAYTPERVLSWRVGPLEEVLTGSAGTIFEKLIAKVNIAEQTILRSGFIWRGGPQRQETLNPQPLNEYLQGLWERSGEDYTWTPSVGSDGKLTVLGRWLPFLGDDPGVRLHEGRGGGNVEAVGRIMVEDGPIITNLLAYGDGETWKSKPYIGVGDPVARGRYGLRHSAFEFTGVTSVETLRSNGLQKIAEFKNPARSFLLNALNVGDTFKYIGLGNMFHLRLESVGFRAGAVGFAGRVRVVGMSYNPNMKNKIQLVVRELL